MLRGVLNKHWKQHPIKQQLYGHSLPISQTIQVRRTRHAGHLQENEERTHKWRSSVDPSTWLSQWWMTSKNLNHLCVDNGCSLGDLLGAMVDRDGWRERERVREICAVCLTRGWWWGGWYERIQKILFSLFMLIYITFLYLVAYLMTPKERKLEKICTMYSYFYKVGTQKNEKKIFFLNSN